MKIFIILLLAFSATAFAAGPSEAQIKQAVVNAFKASAVSKVIPAGLKAEGAAGTILLASVADACSIIDRYLVVQKITSIENEGRWWDSIGAAVTVEYNVCPGGPKGVKVQKVEALKLNSIQ